MICYPADKNPDKVKDMEPFDLELVHDNVRECEQGEDVLIIDKPHGVGE